jgi:flagellar L-ring protein precursor FlgH
MKKPGMLFLRTFILAMITVFAVTGAVQADSLWADNSGSLYTKNKSQFRVGDLLTVVVVEQASATQKAESSNGKTGDFSASGNGTMGSLLPAFGSEWDSNYKGQGNTTRGGSLQATLTVEVKAVEPNGILVLEGRQVIRVNAEDQILTIKGRTRSEDVHFNNVVMSTSISDAVIEYQGKGTVGATQKPGALIRFFHWLF